jgi:addiction module HigA family antidote
MSAGDGYINVHPGSVLKDEIEYRKLSEVELAKELGISYKLLMDILNEKKPVTVEIAMRFAVVMDLPFNSLLNLQREYDIIEAKKSKSFAKLLSDLKKKKPKAKSKVAAMV